MIHKRGQAALEFLSTYGFAFLIILVMIGALTYFGVLSPSRFVPERCLVGSEFACEDFQLAATGTGANVSIVLTNQAGNSVTLLNANANASSQYGSVALPTDCVVTPAGPIQGGSSATVVCSMVGTFPAPGEKIKVQIDLQYRELGGTFPHPVTAEVLATLQ